MSVSDEDYEIFGKCHFNPLQLWFESERGILVAQIVQNCFGGRSKLEFLFVFLIIIKFVVF